MLCIGLLAGALSGVIGIRLSSAIYGRWPARSRGHLNVGCELGRGQPATAAIPTADWRPSRLVSKSLRITK